jgi:hypothetical protein
MIIRYIQINIKYYNVGGIGPEQTKGAQSGAPFVWKSGIV